VRHMGTEPGTAVLSMNCQVKRDCTHLAGYVLSGGLSSVMRYTCALHLVEAIDDALGELVFTSQQYPVNTWTSVTVQRA
jgi:hypothetical protein